MMNSLDNSILIVPSSKKRDWLEYRNSHPYEDFHLYSLEEFLGLFHYAYEEEATAYLLKKGYSLSKAEALLSSLRKLSLDDPLDDAMKDLLKELVEAGLFYKEELPEKLFIGKKVYYQGLEELALKEARRHLPEVVFIPIEEEKAKTIPPFYEFSDSYKEVHYLLNDIAHEIELGRDPSRIFIYGASGESKNALHFLAPRFGFGLKGYKKPLSSSSLFRKFISSLNEEVNDRDLLISLGGEEKEVKKIASLIKKFESFPLEERKALYLENSHAEEVSFPSTLEGPSFLSDPHAPKDSLVYIIDASLGNFPSSSGEEFFLPDEKKRELGLLTSQEENVLKEKEARNLLSSPEVKWVSYSKKSGTENVEPSFLLPKAEKAPIQEYEYDHDRGMTLASFLLDEQDDSGHHDGRLDALPEEAKKDHGSFPKGYSKVKGFKKKSRHSYSSLSKYPQCPYQYYCASILNLDAFEETFVTKLGSYFHKAIEEFVNGNDEVTAQEIAKKDMLKNGPLSPKEEILMRKYEDFLPLYLKHVKEREDIYAPHEGANEIVINGTTKKGTPFYAQIDRLIDFGDDLLVIDYKTTNAQAFKEELFFNHAESLQLPYYAMALKNDASYRSKNVSAIFIAPIVLDNSALGVIDSRDEVDEKELFKKWKLDGVMAVERVSSLLGEEEGKKLYITKRSFDSSGKAPSLEDIEGYIALTEKYLDFFDEKISQGEFARTPMVIQKGSSGTSSCQYCGFRDVCYRNEEEVVYKNAMEKEASFPGLPHEDER